MDRSHELYILTVPFMHNSNHTNLRSLLPPIKAVCSLCSLRSLCIVNILIKFVCWFFLLDFDCFVLKAIKTTFAKAKVKSGGPHSPSISHPSTSGFLISLQVPSLCIVNILIKFVCWFFLLDFDCFVLKAIKTTFAKAKVKSGGPHSPSISHPSTSGFLIPTLSLQVPPIHVSTNQDLMHLTGVQLRANIYAYIVIGLIFAAISIL